MKKQERLVVLGAGGHARMVVMALNALGYKSGVFLDDDARKKGVPFLGGWSYAGEITQICLTRLAIEGADYFIVGIGSVDADGSAVRDRFYQMALAARLKPITAFSPTAVILGHVGEGVFVGPGAIVMPGAIIGPNSIINTGAIVEHDCHIGWSSHIATGAVLCGGVKVGKGVHVGAGAIVKQGVTIGDGATVGMGAVVLDDIAEGLIVVGNPAKSLHWEYGDNLAQLPNREVALNYQSTLLRHLSVIAKCKIEDLLPTIDQLFAEREALKQKLAESSGLKR